MVRKGNSSRGGRITPRKAKIGAGTSTAERNLKEDQGPTRFLGVKSSHICNLADKTFQLISRVCENFSLFPFQRIGNGMIVAASPKQIRRCYIWLALGGLTCVYKLWATAQLAMHADVNLRLFVCLASFLLSFVSWCLPFTLTLLVREGTMDLVNSWQTAILGGKKKELFADIPTCLQLIVASMLPPFLPLVSGFIMAYFKDLPVSWIWLAKKTGLVQANSNAFVLVNIVCVLLEVLSSFLLWTAWAMTVSIFFAGLGVLKILLADTRNAATVTDLKSRKRVEKLYRVMSVYNRMFYVRTMAPSALVCGSMAIILSIFMSLSDLNLPLVLVVFSPLAAATALTILYGAIYVLDHKKLPVSRSN